MRDARVRVLHCIIPIELRTAARLNLLDPVLLTAPRRPIDTPLERRCVSVDLHAVIA